MKVSSIVITLLLLYLSLPVSAQQQANAEPMKFSLNEAKQYAMQNSPILLNSARDVEIAKKKIWETTATGLPQAELTGSYSYSPKLAGLTDLFTGGDTSGGGGSPFGFEINPDDLKKSFFMDVQVSQLIFSGQYIVGLQASKAYANMSKLAESKSKVDLVETISNVYFEALVNRSTKRTLDSTLAVVEKTYHQTEQLYKTGFAESTDVDQLKIQILNIKSSLTFQMRRIEFTEKLLKYHMGLSIDQEIELTDDINGLIQLMELETATIDSLRINDNIDYQLLTTTEKLSKLNLKLQKSNFLPTVAGFYNRHEDFDNNFFNDQSPDMVGLSLRFTILSSGQRLSQVGQAKLEYMKAQTNTKMFSEMLLIQYETMLASYLSARDVFNMQKENRDLSYRVYLKSITKFQEGVGSSLDMNQAQSQYFTAESNYYGALMTLVTTRSNLENLLSKNN
jgi:outer membrane protein TolC